MISKSKIATLVVLLLLATFAQAQVKFRVKNLNADILVAFIPEKEGTEYIEVFVVTSMTVFLCAVILQVMQPMIH